MRWALLAGLLVFASADAGIILSSSPRVTAPAAGGGGGAFAMPLGIPDYPWDFQEAIPSVPDPWSTSTAGFYYVCSSGSAGDNGTPTAPRATIPDLSAVPDGSVVVMCNTATYSGTSITINPIGTSTDKIWLVGSQQVGLGSGSTEAIIQYTGDFAIDVGSQWFVIDGIDFFNNSTNQTGWYSATNTNAVIRHSTIRGNGQDRAANSSNSISGTNTTTRSQYVMLYDVEVRDMGLYTHVGGDIDVHGIQIGQWVDDLWIIGGRYFRNQGDGIQLTGDGNPNNNTPTVARRIYVGDNTFYENLQTGFWIKTGDVVIFSENTVYNHTDGGGSAPVGVGGQYDFANYWIVNNWIHDNGNGVRIASENNGAAPVIRVIGNVISGSNGTGGTVQNDSAFSDGVGVAFWQAGTLAVEFNTISGYAGHCVTATNGSGNDVRIENNICRGRSAYANATSRWDILVESVTTQPKVRNNSFESSPRFTVNGSSWTSVSTFESASSANRSDNISGSISVDNDVTGASGNFDVVGGSATIGAGLVTTDLFGEYQTDYSLDIAKAFNEMTDYGSVTRPASTTYDMGAHEH